VLTFDPHPLTLITDEPPLLLNSTRRRKLLIEERYGVDKMIVLPFDEEFSHYLPEEFVERIIVTKFGFKHIVVGFNFHFGAGGRGDAEQLAALCAEHGIGVSIIPAISSAYGIISATSIRTKIEAGDIVAANEMLGYWYGIGGCVIMGNQIGRTIGFPTANFLPPEGRVLPPCGVYAARIEYNGGTADGIVNFGYRPTFGGCNQLVVEAHLFDVDRDLYDQEIFVHFGFWLRPEVCFKSLDGLQEQLKSDAAQAREIFTKIGAKEHLLKLKE
jgi:riboflavin kinase/FMN adenylyltransferase